jgi:hypothetical protein
MGNGTSYGWKRYPESFNYTAVAQQMNPYAIIATILIFISSLTGAYFKGRHDQKADNAQTANEAASKALATLKNDLQPKVNNYYRETTKYPDCYATEEGWNALNEVYDAK